MKIIGAIIYFAIIATAACSGVLIGYAIENRLKKNKNPITGAVLVKMEFSDTDLENLAEKLAEKTQGQDND